MAENSFELIRSSDHTCRVNCLASTSPPAPALTFSLSLQRPLLAFPFFSLSAYLNSLSVRPTFHPPVIPSPFSLFYPFPSGFPLRSLSSIPLSFFPIRSSPPPVLLRPISPSANPTHPPTHLLAAVATYTCQPRGTDRGSWVARRHRGSRKA